MKPLFRSTRHLYIGIIAFILSLANVYAAQVLVIFGSPTLFALALLIEIILIVIVLYCLERSLTVPENIIKSLSLSIWNGLASNEYIVQIRKSKSPFLIWIRRRLKYGQWTGLPLTVTILTALFLVMNFLSVLSNVVSKGSMTQIDMRVINLIPSIRTPTQTTVFRFVTTLANAETAIVLMLLTAALFWRNRQRFLAGLTIVVAAGEEALSFLMKTLVHRPRPDSVFRLIKESSYSFPSGHVLRATVLFGLLSYFLYKSYTSLRARILIVSSLLLSVLLVGVSRVYLGVHYPTDIWASALLGGAVLALVVGMLEIVSRYKVNGHKTLELANKRLLIVPAILIIFSLIAAPFMVGIEPKIEDISRTTLEQINEASAQKLPLYSETLTGGKMEPINFIYAGTQAQIISIFESHGWYRADPSTFTNTLRAIAVGFQSRQYLTAPVTPSYLNYKPETIAFEQATEKMSLRQRHHTRLWQTDYILPSGKPVWVATASYDEGIEFVGTLKLPTHHIDPNIDGERDFIVKSLEVSSNLIKVVGPQQGKNASGDSFFTDGKAQIIVL